MDECGCSTGLSSSTAHCKIINLSVLDGMVVVALSHRHKSCAPGTRGSLINFMSFSQKMVSENDVGGI